MNPPMAGFLLPVAVAYTPRLHIVFAIFTNMVCNLFNATRCGGKGAKMAARVIHLNKGGEGWASRTACGRGLLRTPMSTDWHGFTGEMQQNRCARCDTSAYAVFLRGKDGADLSAWEPVQDANAWMAADDALIAAHRARKAAAGVAA
jgi:hypothetical protein